MYNNEQFAEYGALAKKIIKRKKWIIAITVVLVLLVILVILVSSPIQIAIFDKTYVDYKGVNPVVAVLLVLLVFFFEFIAIAFLLLFQIHILKS